MNYENIGFVAAILLFGALAARFLRKHSLDPRTRFNVSDLLLGEDGKASKTALVMFTALSVTTWTLIYVTINRPEHIDALFISYCGIWATPAVTVLIVNAYKAGPPSQNVTLKTVEGDVTIQPQQPA